MLNLCEVTETDKCGKNERINKEKRSRDLAICRAEAVAGVHFSSCDRSCSPLSSKMMREEVFSCGRVEPDSETQLGLINE